MRAYAVGVKGAPWAPATIFADNAGKAKYRYLGGVRDAWPDITFADLTCRGLGDSSVPPTPTEIAQRECDAFNVEFPIGTILHYWSGLKEGGPTGTAPINHPATVMCDHAVIWMEGVRSCHSLTHVERARQPERVPKVMSGRNRPG